MFTLTALESVNGFWKISNFYDSLFSKSTLLVFLLIDVAKWSGRIHRNIWIHISCWIYFISQLISLNAPYTFEPISFLLAVALVFGKVFSAVQLNNAGKSFSLFELLVIFSLIGSSIHGYLHYMYSDSSVLYAILKLDISSMYLAISVLSNALILILTLRYLQKHTEGDYFMIQNII